MFATRAIDSFIAIDPCEPDLALEIDIGKNTAACLKVELSGVTTPTSARRAVSYFLPMSTSRPSVFQPGSRL